VIFSFFSFSLFFGLDFAIWFAVGCTIWSLRSGVGIEPFVSLSRVELLIVSVTMSGSNGGTGHQAEKWSFFGFDFLGRFAATVEMQITTHSPPVAAVPVPQPIQPLRTGER
jgi:hypothetical protein